MLSLQDTAVLPLIRGTGMLTLGSQQRNIDFETEWRQKMHVFLDPAHVSKKAKGGSMSCIHTFLHVCWASVSCMDTGLYPKKLRLSTCMCQQQKYSMHQNTGHVLLHDISSQSEGVLDMTIIAVHSNALDCCIMVFNLTV